MLGGDGDRQRDARERVLRAMGAAALIDAAAIVATFQQMDRIADATGIPLDAVVDVASRDVQQELGLAAFGSARNTRPSSAIARLAARLLGPIRTPMMKVASRLLR